MPETLISLFRQYRRIAHFNVTHRRRQAFYALPSAEWALLSAPPFNFLATLEQVDDSIDTNADLATQILETGLQSFGLEKEPCEGPQNWRGSATHIDLDKARSTIRQLYRDWSSEGASEREASYAPVVQDLTNAFANVPDKGDVRVLVPGAGLGRLVFELCDQGYDVEGNEVSFHQLLTSSWILNQTAKAEQYSLYPFAFDFSNVVSRSDQLRMVKIPDVHPATALAESHLPNRKDASDRMRMTAADFSELYSDVKNKAMFDAVVTVFFVDTAPNVIRYIQTVHNCLKPGGLWTNNGPLLWHWADRGLTDKEGEAEEQHHPKSADKLNYGRVELSVEEILMLISSMGFEVVDKGIRSEGCGYIQNPNSMLQSQYRVSHWTAKKKS